jgi:hypothetical protein
VIAHARPGHCGGIPPRCCARANSKARFAHRVSLENLAVLMALAAAPDAAAG